MFSYSPARKTGTSSHTLPLLPPHHCKVKAPAGVRGACSGRLLLPNKANTATALQIVSQSSVTSTWFKKCPLVYGQLPSGTEKVSGHSPGGVQCQEDSGGDSNHRKAVAWSVGPLGSCGMVVPHSLECAFWDEVQVTGRVVGGGYSLNGYFLLHRTKAHRSALRQQLEGPERLRDICPHRGMRGGVWQHQVPRVPEQGKTKRSIGWERVCRRNLCSSGRCLPTDNRSERFVSLWVFLSAPVWCVTWMS